MFLEVWLGEYKHLYLACFGHEPVQNLAWRVSIIFLTRLVLYFVRFGTYEAVKIGMMQAQGIEDMSKLSPLSVLTAGGFAGMACWVVSIPADVLKSRFQGAPEGTYKNVADVYSTLMRNEGPAALFTGIRPALIRAFPANAACFFGMEVARKSLAFLD
jgi:solute carrier family 25 carnitine/acylcarnitine transporter 20/29